MVRLRSASAAQDLYLAATFSACFPQFRCPRQVYRYAPHVQLLSDALRLLEAEAKALAAPQPALA